MTEPNGNGSLGSRWCTAVGCGLVLVLAVGCGDDADPGPPDGAPLETGDPETGGLEVDAPEGWHAVPLPSLGFGLALPDGWESLVLSDEGLTLLENASPEVPGFALSAMAAYEAEAIFYGAGLDGEDENLVNDLKVRADTASGVADVADLATYAEEQLEGGLDDLDNVTLTVVEDAEVPAVDARYRTAVTVPHGQEGEEGEEVQVEGAERFMLAPTGVVYSVIVTGESAASVEEVAPAIFATVTFLPPDQD